MTKRPTLATVMTPFPYSIEVDADIRAAGEMMASHDIRHLPVTRGHELVGVVSDRDLLVARALGGADAPDASVSVEAIMTPDPFVVDLHAPLSTVLERMTGAHLGSVLVTRDGKLAGIVTTTDVCQLAFDLLGGPQGGGEAA